jgi:hypothetical protein
MRREPRSEWWAQPRIIRRSREKGTGKDRESRLAVPLSCQSLGMPFAGGVDAVPVKAAIAPVGVSSVV